MTLPTFIPARTRRHASRRGAATSPTPAGALQLLSATVVSFEGSDAGVELVFDATPDDPIVNIESANPTQWTGTIDGYLFAGNSPLELASYNTVTLYMGNQGESSGPNQLSYAADPADIETASGRKLGAFADRPL
ncbi:MAG: hypothetical protein QM770_02530 [Tepidisphaeraceae bacterium]